MNQKDKPKRDERCLRNRLWFYNAVCLSIFAYWCASMASAEIAETFWVNMGSRIPLTLGCAFLIKISHCNAVMSARCLDLLRNYEIRGDEESLQAFRRLQTKELQPQDSSRGETGPADDDHSNDGEPSNDSIEAEKPRLFANFFK